MEGKYGHATVAVGTELERTIPIEKVIKIVHEKDKEKRTLLICSLNDKGNTSITINLETERDAGAVKQDLWLSNDAFDLLYYALASFSTLTKRNTDVMVDEVQKYIKDIQASSNLLPEKP